METEKKPEGKPEMDTAPMRISFKVPTLFFKKPTSGTEKLQSSQAEERDEEMKITPPSVKDKLEESESEDDEQTEPFAAPTVPHHDPSSDEKLEATEEGDSDSKTVADNVKTESHRLKKSNRPMPASMRRKLVTNNLNLDTTKAPESDEDLDSNNDDEQTPPFEAHIVPHNGQPSSADEKLEATADADGDSDSDSKTTGDNEKSDSHRPKKSNRPMPASMRRKLGKNNLDTSKAPESDEDSNRADEQTEQFPKTMADNETSDSHRPKKSHRPMPASMRRKLEKNNLDPTIALESDESNEMTDAQSRDEPASGSTSKNLSMSADEEEYSNDSTRKSDTCVIRETKKINISLGGIILQNSGNGHEQEQTENQDVPGKSSASKRELQSLTTGKYCCQYCDYESYSLYTKNKHEEGHFKVKENPSEITKKEPKAKTKKKAVKSVSKYKDFCPYCDRRIGNTRKLRKHVSSCTTRRRSKCKTCNKQFNNVTDFRVHNEQFHSVNQDESLTLNTSQSHEHEHEEPGMDQSSPPSPNNSSVVAKSVVSTKSDDKSNTGHQSEEPLNDRSTNVDSFKRKMANVLGNLGSRNKNMESERDVDFTENDGDEAPPHKKTKTESIRGLAMPASVRKKLEDREKDGQNITLSVNDGLDDLDCEVCYRVFTRLSYRQKHERNVHSIKNPRGRSASRGELRTPKTPKSKAKAPKLKNSSSLTLEDIPNRGKCPVCFKFISGRLKRHARNVHKIPLSKNAVEKTDTTINHTEIRKPIKTFKIYKSAADKAKKKLASQPSSQLKKMLEDRVKNEKNSVSSSSKGVSKNLNSLECAVCNRIFTQLSNRQRHERTVHSIKNPRSQTFPSQDEIQAEEKPKPKAKAPIQQMSKSLTLEDLPKKGKCPICSKFIQQDLRRHAKNAHNIPNAVAVENTLSDSEADPIKQHTEDARASPPESYKIHKSTTDKAKTKVGQRPSSPLEQLETSSRPSVEVEAAATETKMKKPQETNSKPEVKKQGTSGSSVPTEFKCACCDEVFGVNIDFNEQMLKRIAKSKRFITCKICMNQFSNEEDFILHIQFRHKYMVSGMEKQKGSTSQNLSATTPRPHLSNSNTKINQSKSSVGDKSNQRRTRRQLSPSPAHNPEPMDTCDDNNGPDSPVGVDSLNKMPCNACKEVFYSFEALGKHVLYFHGMKTSKMCPICGAYPPRLSVHLLAHENQTVKCSCDPCELNFADFASLLKHNLRSHPGPSGSAVSTISTANKNITEVCKDSKENQTGEVFRCKLCKKKISGSSLARSHVRRSHPEREEHPEKYLEKVEEQDDNMDVGDALEDETVNGKLLDSEREDDRPSSPITGSSNCPSLNSENTNTKKPKRPLPASVLAKLEAQKKKNAIEDATSSTSQGKPNGFGPKTIKRPLPASLKTKLETLNANEENDTIPDVKPVPLHKPGRPMPASLRAAKLASNSQKGSTSISDTISISSKISSSGDKPKPSRPMPASFRAKLASNSQKGPSSIISDTASNSSKISSSEDKPKPNRPMPASLRAKLASNSQSGPASIHSDTASNSSKASSSRDKPKRAMPASARARLLNKAELNEPIAGIEDSVALPTSVDSLGFSIADEIANHNKTAQTVVVGPSSSNSSRSSKNKKSFNSADDISGHIQGDHDEDDYRPDHTETMNRENVSRQRRSNVNYNKSYRHDEDDEEQVNVSRGTTRRPRGSPGRDPLYSHHVAPSPALSHSVENMEANLLMYACKFCGKRMDKAVKVKLHISRAHPDMKGLHEDEVIFLEAGREHEFVPMPNGTPQEIIPPVVAPAVVSPIQVPASASPHKPKPKRAMPASARARLLNKAELKEPISVGQDSVPLPPGELPPPAIGFKCKVCQITMDHRSSLVQHISRSHPEVTASAGDVGGEGDTQLIQCFIQDVLENSALDTYSCGICSFQTTDENDYVLHYKTHTGVSPYRCQYCAATFDRQLQLTNHVTREHTGAEFLNDDEAEISMEEMVGVGEISVSTATRIQIDQPKVISLNRFSNKIASQETDSLETPEDPFASEEQIEPNTSTDPIADGDNDSENENNDTGVEEQSQETESSKPYKGDLSSYFPTLGGSEIPSSLVGIDDGMDLD